MVAKVRVTGMRGSYEDSAYYARIRRHARSQESINQLHGRALVRAIQCAILFTSLEYLSRNVSFTLHSSVP